MSLDESVSPHVVVILVNYQGVSHTLACLESLQGLSTPNVSVVVVDNASQDGSAPLLKDAQDRLSFHLIESQTNLGFSGGNNLGIDYALAQGADFVWLLNNDTTVEPPTLDFLLAEAKRTGGLVGSVLLYPDKRYQQVGTRINWMTGSTRGYPETELTDGMNIECLCGASMLIPTHAFKNVGKLEESYFLYFEDAEYTLRARQRSYTATLALRSRVFHVEGATTGKRSLATQYYFHRNRYTLLRQHATPMERLTMEAYTTFRLMRAFTKGLRHPEKMREATIQWQAIQDAKHRRLGKMPQPLS